MALISKHSGEHTSIVEANATLALWTGMSPQCLASLPLTSLLPPDTRQVVQQSLESHPKQRQFKWETRLIAPKGRSRPVELTVSDFPLDGPDTRLVLIRDISTRQHIEQLLTQATENEQRRLGNELHDTLCQDLTTIELLSRVASSSVHIPDTELREDLILLENLGRKVATQARVMAQGLFPSSLEDSGLCRALERLANDIETLHPVSCTFACGAHPEFSDKSSELHLYRIAQEAINNAIRHGDADVITLSLDNDGNGYALTVTDNGNGNIVECDLEESMGIAVMRHRARMSNGQLSIRSEKDSGTQVSCVWNGLSQTT